MNCSSQCSAFNSALCCLACSVLVCTICIVLSVMIFLLNDHNNRGYSRSRYELGNKCAIRTHVGCEIICCCCVIDRSQLQLNHWLIHLRNSYMAGTEGETRFCSLPWLLCAVCLRWCCCLGIVGCCVGEVNVVCCCCCLRCCLGFCGLVFWKAIYFSTLVYFTSPLQVSYFRDHHLEC